MTTTKSKAPIIIGIIIAIIVFILFGNLTNENVVAGKYREANLTLTLNEDYSFTYYNGVSGTSARGTYTYTVSEDERYAYVSLSVTSGSCSYDGAKVYSMGDATFLIPKIGGSEIAARTMVRR